MRTDLGLSEYQPSSVIAILKEAGASLAEAEGKVNDADLTAVQEPGTLREIILGKLQAFRASWSADVDASLAHCDAWQEPTPFPDAVQRIKSRITELAGKNDVKTLLLSAQDLQSDLTARFLRVAVPGVLQQARDIHTHLTDGHEPKLAKELAVLQTAIDGAALERVAATSESLAPLAEKIHSLRDAVIAALEAANPRPAQGQPELPINGISDGKFVTALEYVMTRRGNAQERELSEELGPGAGVQMTPPPRLTELRAPIRSTWQIALEAPTVAIAGQPVILRARVISAADAVPAVSRVCWYVNDELVKVGPQALEHMLLVSKASTLAVRVEAESDGGERREARLKLAVGPFEAPAALTDLVKQMKWTEIKLTAVSGVMIAVIGFLLYREMFVGGLGDFAAAFFWGSSTDIGVAKVRELSTSLTSRFSQPGAARAGG